MKFTSNQFGIDFSRDESNCRLLLFVGQKGLGKFELAKQFAAGLLCEVPQDHGIACGKCLACNWF